MQKRHPAAGVSDLIVARMRKASQPEKEGIAICAEIAAKAKDVQGVRGVHILSSGREGTLAPILEQAGLARA
jgi:methylenetetrahydrofolate reductase (NADPH)